MRELAIYTHLVFLIVSAKLEVRYAAFLRDEKNLLKNQ